MGISEAEELMIYLEVIDGDGDILSEIESLISALESRGIEADCFCDDAEEALEDEEVMLLVAAHQDEYDEVMASIDEILKAGDYNCLQLDYS